jgi:hypothetical protein
MTKRLLIILLLINFSNFLRRAVIKSDFLINDDTTGGCKQEKPTIVMNDNGDYIVVWKDFRDGGSNIYPQGHNKLHIPQGDGRNSQMVR